MLCEAIYLRLLLERGDNKERRREIDGREALRGRERQDGNLDYRELTIKLLVDWMLALNLPAFLLLPCRVGRTTLRKAAQLRQFCVE